MPKKGPELAEQRFGRLTVIAKDGKVKQGKTTWLCLCDCGATKVVVGSNLTSGNTTSCGCLHAQVMLHTHTKHGHGKQGQQSPEYDAWRAATKRCSNPSNPDWKNYGGLGVRNLFTDFEQFWKTLGKRPTPKHSLGRILDRGNYEPGNVFWQTQAEQSLAKKNNHSLLKWAAKTKEATISNRR